MKRRIILTLAICILPSCTMLDSARWTVGTTYDPITKQVSFNIGKEPIPTK